MFGDWPRDPGVPTLQPHCSPNCRSHPLERGEDRNLGAVGSRQGPRAPVPVAAARGCGCTSTSAVMGSSPEPAGVWLPAIPISTFTMEKKKKTQMSLVCFGGSLRSRLGVSSCRKGKKLH